MNFKGYLSFDGKLQNLAKDSLVIIMAANYTD